MMLAGLMAPMLLAAMQAAPAAPTLGDVRVHLFYARSGRLSPNIAPPASFSAWNTIIGEGEAEEPADDMIATVAIRSAGAEANTATPITLTARNEAGRVIATRRWPSVLIGDSGETVLPLFLPGTTCIGPLTIEAVMGAARRRVTVDMRCGE